MQRPLSLGQSLADELSAADPSLQLIQPSHSHPSIASLQSSPEDYILVSSHHSGDIQSETSKHEDTSQPVASTSSCDQNPATSAHAYEKGLHRTIPYLCSPEVIEIVHESCREKTVPKSSEDEFPEGLGFIDDEPKLKNEFYVKSNSTTVDCTASGSGRPKSLSSQKSSSLRSSSSAEEEGFTAVAGPSHLYRNDSLSGATGEYP